MDYSNIMFSILSPLFPITFANSSSDFYSAESMGYISTRERAVFFSLFLLLYIAAVLGNTAAIFTTCKRKHRYIQKTLVVSLALSDLIMATSYAVQYLNTFAHALLNWTMGEIMCFLIPYLQIFGVAASSGAILIIALDRYRSAVHATMKRWNPNVMMCLFGITLLWFMAGALAYPSQIIIFYRKIIIVSTDGSGELTYMDGYVCIAKEKYDVITYYSCITATVFLPLLIMVLWLYYNICKLVYKQKKTKKLSSAVVQCSNGATRTILKKQSDVLMVPQRRNFQTERRIRIFKIMLLLILAFIVCRAPHWIYRTIKKNYDHTDSQQWIISFALSGLVFLNCILNPFLYTFLPQTITKMAKVWKTISDFTCEVCCCCCSNSEFEQFEKENPFSVENYDKGKSINDRQPNKDARVKFEDITTTQSNKNKY